MTTCSRSIAAGLLAVFAAATQADAQTFRGNYTDQNVAEFFSAIEQRRGKTLVFDVTLNMAGSSGRFQIRRTACLIQIVDTGSTPQRIIELFNVDDSKGTALRWKGTGPWAVNAVVNGRRSSACGSGEVPTPVPRGTRTYELSPVG
jgi:hypothetical protein